MNVSERVADRGPDLAWAADRIYRARRDFFVERFDGYVDDTYYIPGTGYVCWPAQTDGYFEGYYDLLPGEEETLTELRADGFELLGNGASRIACAFPDESELVVKFGRCGMGEQYGTGRRHNVVEYLLSEDDLPVLPCYYCDPKGRFAIYPRADETATADLSTAKRDAIRERMMEAAPFIDAEELVSPENVCRWDGTLRALDYSMTSDFDPPLGTPAHVDSERFIEGVDERRRRGEKRDISDSGGYLPEGGA